MGTLGEDDSPVVEQLRGTRSQLAVGPDEVDILWRWAFRQARLMRRCGAGWTAEVNMAIARRDLSLLQDLQDKAYASKLFRQNDTCVVCNKPAGRLCQQCIDEEKAKRGF